MGIGEYLSIFVVTPVFVVSNVCLLKLMEWVNDCLTCVVFTVHQGYTNSDTF